MGRRAWLLLLAGARYVLAATDKLRGRLGVDGAGKPAIITGDGRVVTAEGDSQTLAVLRDQRLADADFEAEGQLEAPGRFRIEPIHNRALFLYRDGKRLVITYWCEICSIRTYSPGLCVCCQEETKLDPRDPGLKDADPSTA